jgi:hypothetical protein
MSTENASNNTENSESVLAEQYDEIRTIHMEGYEIGVRRARNVMLIIAAFTAAFAGYIYYKFDGLVNYLFWVLFVLPAFIYVALAYLTKTKPYLAVLLGLIIYIGFWILSYVIGGFESLMIGNIIVKIVFIFYLYNGLKDAKLLEEARREGGAR